MGRARFLWLLLPIAGLAELFAFVHDARSAPRLNEWQALRGELAALKRPTDLVVVAPEWADPLPRAAFGELNATADEVASWPVREERRVGRFRIRVRENPAPARILFSFLNEARPPVLSVTDLATDLAQEGARPCAFTTHAASSAGGLHGHLAFPRERFNCGGEEFFVG